MRECHQRTDRNRVAPEASPESVLLARLEVVDLLGTVGERCLDGSDLRALHTWEVDVEPVVRDRQFAPRSRHENAQAGDRVFGDTEHLRPKVELVAASGLKSDDAEPLAGPILSERGCLASYLSGYGSSPLSPPESNVSFASARG